MLVSLFFSGLPALPAHAAANTSNIAAGQLLKPNGTLDLSTGYSGSLDISKYAVTLDSVRGPVLSLLSRYH